MLYRVAVILWAIVFITGFGSCKGGKKQEINLADSAITIHTAGRDITVSIRPFGKYKHVLRAKVSGRGQQETDNAITLPYPVYHFELGDVTGDGQPDILVGVVKSTHFHPDTAKRIFMYRLDSGRIRPLWLGSHLSHPIVDFRYCVHNRQPFIRALETDKNNSYLVAEYRWQGFGLALEKYLLRNADKEQAIKKFHE